MKNNSTYKNTKTGTIYSVGGHNTVIKQTGQPPRTVETQWARRNKNL